MPKKNAGFTLIELLVVIGILGILLAIVLIAINPSRQFAQANNTKRSSDVTAILNAISQYRADNHGKLPTGMPAPAASPVPVAIGGAVGGADICLDIVTNYISMLPQDPTVNNGAGLTEAGCVDEYVTGYEVAVDLGGRVTVSAPEQEAVAGQTVDISVTR
jgi:prepilin-type N-terminal cleavage/methylation domain-containing protein